MATKTLGTSTTSGLTAVPYLRGWNSGVSAADMGTMARAIKNDGYISLTVQGGNHGIWPEAFSENGLLYYPNRGVLKVLPGDWVGVDANGWPVLVSKYSIATGGWTHS